MQIFVREVFIRNQAMVHYIAKLFEWFPERNVLLVLVGASHVPDLGRRLVCNEGYEAVKVTRGLSLTYNAEIEEPDNNEIGPSQ